MAGKLPAFQFYPADWLKDPVSGCSLAAQGLWLRMMIVMHFSDRYGYLSNDGSPIHPSHTAQRCGTPLGQYETLLAELDSVGVPRRLTDGTIYSKRMVEDDKSRKKYREFGKRGGNPSLKPPLNPPLMPELKRKREIEDSGKRIGSGKGENGVVAESSFSKLRKIMEKKT